MGKSFNMNYLNCALLVLVLVLVVMCCCKNTERFASLAEFCDNTCNEDDKKFSQKEIHNQNKLLRSIRSERDNLRLERDKFLPKLGDKAKKEWGGIKRCRDEYIDNMVLARSSATRFHKKKFRDMAKTRQELKKKKEEYIKKCTEKIKNEVKPTTLR